MALGLRLIDILEALRSRGRIEKAEQYEHAFLALYCPPLEWEQVLALPFDDLCVATALLKTMRSFSGIEGRVATLNRQGYAAVPGTPYFKGKGKQ